MIAALAFGRAAFQQHLTYRIANLAGIFTNASFLVMRAYVFEACYVARDSIGGLSVAQAVTFPAQDLDLSVHDAGIEDVVQRLYTGRA